MSNESSRNVRTPLDWGKASDTQSPTPSPESGNQSTEVIILTDAAQDEVRRLIAHEGKAGGLRLGIKGGGCSGLSYMLDFTEEQPGDTVVAFDGFEVYLDQKSTIYLSGVTLDFQSGLNGRGFVFHNPQASNTCGCGESFSI